MGIRGLLIITMIFLLNASIAQAESAITIKEVIAPDSFDIKESESLIVKLDNKGTVDEDVKVEVVAPKQIVIVPREKVIKTKAGRTAIGHFDLYAVDVCDGCLVVVKMGKESREVLIDVIGEIPQIKEAALKPQIGIGTKLTGAVIGPTITEQKITGLVIAPLADKSPVLQALLIIDLILACTVFVYFRQKISSS